MAKIGFNKTFFILILHIVKLQWLLSPNDSLGSLKLQEIRVWGQRAYPFKQKKIDQNIKISKNTRRWWMIQQDKDKLVLRNFVCTRFLVEISNLKCLCTSLCCFLIFIYKKKIIVGVVCAQHSCYLRDSGVRYAARQVCS